MDGNDFDTFDLMQVFDAASNRKLGIDLDRYQYMLDSTDLTDSQKQEVLEALWSIIVTVVELGYGVHPLQEVCGKPDKLSDEWSASNPDALDCENSSDEENKEDAPEAD